MILNIYEQRVVGKMGRGGVDMVKYEMIGSFSSVDSYNSCINYSCK